MSENALKLKPSVPRILEEFRVKKPDVFVIPLFMLSKMLLYFILLYYVCVIFGVNFVRESDGSRIISRIPTADGYS